MNFPDQPTPLKTKLTSTVFISITILLGVLLNGCSEDKPIKIAFIGAISGKNSEVATSVRNAVIMKIDKVNEQGGIKGRPIELSFFDNMGKMEDCETQFDNIFSQKVPFIIGPIFSQMAEPTLSSIKGKDVLVMSPTMSTSYLSGKDDNFLRTCPSGEGQAKKLADYILAKGYKTVGVVYDLSNEKYTRSLYKQVKALIEQEDVKIISEIAIDQSPDKDLTTVAQELNDVTPDCILMCLSALDGANISQQLRKVDSKATFLGVSWTQTNDLLEHGGRSVEGMILISMPRKNAETKEHHTFQKKFEKQYNMPPSFPSFLGYDAATVLFHGMQDATSLTPEAVKRAILKIGTFKGLSDTITINKFGDVKGNYDLVEVRNNEFIYLNK